MSGNSSLHLVSSLIDNLERWVWQSMKYQIINDSEMLKNHFLPGNKNWLKHKFYCQVMPINKKTVKS